MKRIIDAVTYNTDTSTRLARSEYDSDWNHQACHCVGTLYQTRGGAFFEVQELQMGWDDEEQRDAVRHRFQAMSSEEAQSWLMTGEVEVFHNPFEDPPEATAESEAGATIYVRVPLSLKQRLENEAKQDAISGNAWSIRCIEACLARKTVERGLPSGANLSAKAVRDTIGEVFATRFADDDIVKIGTLNNYLEKQLPSNGAGAINAERLRDTLVGVIEMTSDWR